MQGSLPNRLSRWLLAVECIVILVPTTIIAVLLLFPFMVYVLIGSTRVITGVEASQSLEFIAQVSSVALLLIYLITIAAISIGYISEGREFLGRVPRYQWIAILLGMAVFPLWFLAYRQGWSETADEFGVLVLPSLPLTLLAIHLFLARAIARFRRMHA